MKYYQDITLLPDPETDLFFIWKKVYQQVHLALVEQKDENNQVSIGLSWPSYRFSEAHKHIGNKLRVLANSESELNDLYISKWLSRLTDYVHITSIKTIPDNIGQYVSFRRITPKSSNSRMARRKSKREGISFGQALNLIDERKEDSTDLPYIWAKSLSGGQEFPLFVEKLDAKESNEGKFSCYGLSKTATVPWF